MLFQRQKILLTLIAESKQTPTNIELIKWSFLLKQETILKSFTSFYDFVPYQYGPFSFTAYRDLDELRRDGFLDHRTLAIRPGMSNQLTESVATLPQKFIDAAMQILNNYSHLTKDDLIDFVYAKYPWYATKSKLVKNRPKTTSAPLAIYTSGYEGKSIDLFLDDLLHHGVKRIVDVRNNPISRKYGFAKKTLDKLCRKLDLEYVHIPELGIHSSLRRNLETLEDYNQIFDEYERNILPAELNSQKYAISLFKDTPSTLVCFEADSDYCHRSRLAAHLSGSTKLKVINI